MAHKNAGQVARLFDAIHRPDDLILLHMDRRADASMHRLAAELGRRHANVVVLEPLPIVWGGFAAAEVQLRAMAAALRRDGNWQHFINLSGQDFPIKRLEQLDDFLAGSPSTNYVSWFDPLASDDWANARERIERYHLEWLWLNNLLRLRGVGRRIRRVFGWHSPLPHVPGVRRRAPDFRYYGGLNYVVLSRAACAYMVFDRRARHITNWLRHAVHPDEMMTQCVLLNSPLADTVENTSLHAIDFPKHALHPRVYRSADIDRLLQSPKYFARKFDSSQSRVLDRLAERLALRCA
jgi:hypothetical protein